MQVENYALKRRLLDLLTQRLAEDFDDTVTARALLADIGEDLTRLRRAGENRDRRQVPKHWPDHLRSEAREIRARRKSYRQIAAALSAKHNLPQLSHQTVRFWVQGVEVRA